ncbi:MAG: ATP-binding protein [Sphaerochaetaceae bacterium]|nr:ATP-binding protein [Sphaerochaetaceae bacterium]NLO61045.1 ATP-binding protein [Spirochaetales bacterium]MDD2405312.1 ATP-binding protein [Sphaerochaetaceae bacterium]MDD3671015.1 ATP-binding protein [Sphaerochaetaceae bacterium]MDD4258212.1 ATP-binding protein [Sphaerochaetaceae bacterium]
MIIRETYMKQILDFMDKPVVKVITGMRRSGKSVLLELTKEAIRKNGVEEKQIFSINFESLQFENMKNYKALYEAISATAKTANGKLYLLFDEIQEVDSWEKVINSVRVDYDCDIYITGSNARLLSGELATLLSGRYIEIPVYPLSFSEYLEFAKLNEGEVGLNKDQHFSRFLRYGGLPGIHEIKWDDTALLRYLTDMFNSVLLKDVIKRNKIRDIDLLEKVVLYLMDNIGNTFSAKTISDFLKNQGRKLSTETVYTYVKALESAFLIHKVPRFDIKGKRVLETQEKYFVSDLGLRHATIGYRDQDISGILENVVYLELLRRGWTIHIGKQGSCEVDFVATRTDERLYIQVCYVLTEDNTKREFEPLEAIEDNYEKVVISTDSLISFNRNGIRQQNIIEFLLDR